MPREAPGGYPRRSLAVRSMRQGVTLFTAFLILSGCGGPSKGDVYENLVNGERIEVIDSGNCASLIDTYRDAFELRDVDAPLESLVVPIFYPSTDTTGTCFSHPMSSGSMGIGGMIAVRNAGDLDRSWKKLS